MKADLRRWIFVSDEQAPLKRVAGADAGGAWRTFAVRTRRCRFERLGAVAIRAGSRSPGTPISSYGNVDGAAHAMR
jgi:hypothetical protein